MLFVGGSDMIDNANIKGLKSPFKAKVVQVLVALGSAGFQPFVASGVRSLAAQRELVKAGRSRTMKSAHLVGLAADIVDRRFGWAPPSSLFWLMLGREALKRRLTWGGLFGLSQKQKTALSKALRAGDYETASSLPLGWDPAHVELTASPK